MHDAQLKETGALTDNDQAKGGKIKKKRPCRCDKAVFSHQARRTQNSLRPLLAAMRMRSALSLMKPAASAWL